ncbi:rab-GTPase-TBC domain-containing protein [Halteromyces radiatus]|uniref:rab-GTPase-TBC domain-containing protein n=1 Tax=Halteromyces radiatus TaxID=101107 RepID=UPI00222055FB|nr:rab-GTPase-TBC domain-containing protein [Halteromyces radiatus]KAI8079831.1 rab-GTPase-TBC domain-containing protein [Halteromyces radiatus]
MARQRKKKKQTTRGKKDKIQQQQLEYDKDELQEQRKKDEILEAIQIQDLDKLRLLGRQPNGFVSNSLRRKVWPLLLHCPQWNKQNKKYYMPHKDEQQVLLDVARSLGTYPKGLSEKKKKKLQKELNHVIVQVLRKYPKLHYYQGFHDVCTVFLLLFESQEGASQLMGHVALFYLRDAMLESLEPILRELTLLDTLFRLEDEELHQFLQMTGVLPYYCLSWVITWFSHDLDDLPSIYQLFDVFLSSNPMMPLYASAALVMMHRDTILNHFSMDDPSTVHSYLSKLPQQRHLDVTRWIKWMVDLENKWNPLLVQKYGNVALDQVSSINTHHSLLFSTTSIYLSRQRHHHQQQQQYQQLLENNVEEWVTQACDVLTLPPLDRLPLNLDVIKSSKSINMIPPFLTYSSSPPWKMILVSAVGLGTAAILVAHRPDIISSWSY